MVEDAGAMLEPEVIGAVEVDVAGGMAFIAPLFMAPLFMALPCMAGAVEACGGALCCELELLPQAASPMISAVAKAIRVKCNFMVIPKVWSVAVCIEPPENRKLHDPDDFELLVIHDPSAPNAEFHAATGNL